MPLPARLLKGARRDYTLGRLIEMSPVEPTMSGERRLLGLVLPPWQRPEEWAVEQKQRLVESIFLGLGCGYYVTNGLEWLADGSAAPMAGWLLDGQQRIGALRDFLAGELTVFGDVTYASLSKSEAMRFLREPFPCHELEYTNNEAVLKELYNRLNYGGTPHTPEQRAV